MKHVYLFGDGWGAIAAYKGLCKSSELTITVVTEDPNLRNIAYDCQNIKLNDLRDQLIIFDSYKPFVPKSVLETNTCINIHHSLLPKYRGLHSTVWAILNDEPELGFTIHMMNEFMDDGDILFQKAFKNDYISTSTHYMEACNEYKSMHLGEIIEKYLNGSIKPYKQNKSQASWVGKRNLMDCMIDFTRPYQYQKAFFRALVPPYPEPYIVHKGLEYVVNKIDFHPSNVVTHVGRILNIDNEGLWVKSIDGYLIIKELHDRDGRPISMTQFRIGQYLNK